MSDLRAAKQAAPQTTELANTGVSATGGRPSPGLAA